ncbi:MAG: GNAT family N-acetyltransferase [Proteobacteria bacterium]|nr:GNAT family N-acetyltransferase [Pseudomonadota bacterium]
MTVAETARLRLRLLNPLDAPFILALLTDPAFRANVGDRGVHDLASAGRYIIEGPAASYAQFGFGMFAVERKEDARPIGMCGLLRRDSHPDVEIGFAMLPIGRGHGYALEAATASLRLGVERFGLRRIVAITAPDNAGSIRILEQLGFRFERMVRFTADGESRLFIFEPTRTGLPHGS